MAITWYRTLTTRSAGACSRLKSRKPLSREGGAPEERSRAIAWYRTLTTPLLCGRMLSPEVSEAAL